MPYQEKQIASSQGTDKISLLIVWWSSEIKILSNLPKHLFTKQKNSWRQAAQSEDVGMRLPWTCLLTGIAQNALFQVLKETKVQNAKLQKLLPKDIIAVKANEVFKITADHVAAKNLRKYHKGNLQQPPHPWKQTTSFLSKARQGIPLVCAFIQRQGRQTFLLHFLLVDRSRLATGHNCETERWRWKLWKQVQEEMVRESSQRSWHQLKFRNHVIAGSGPTWKRR